MLNRSNWSISGLGSIKEYVKLEPEDPIESSATGKGLRTNSEDGNTKSSEASGSSSYDNKADRSLSVDDVLQCIGSAFLNNKVPSNLAKDIISKLQRGLEFDSVMKTKN
uniref:Uncharacterized protein n=1 Tax=Caenorhabditis japonica TaxID=281687 RepID=A0A8R1EEV8_CAEJA